VPLERGAVYLARVPLRERGSGNLTYLEKLVVLLQDFTTVDSRASQFSYVVCSTDRTGGRPTRLFEVRLGQGDGFDHSTIIDGRWVYTSPRRVLGDAIYRFTLTDQRMDDVSLAIFVGLQLTT
jgi:hypothetical protein